MNIKSWLALGLVYSLASVSIVGAYHAEHSHNKHDQMKMIRKTARKTARATVRKALGHKDYFDDSREPHELDFVYYVPAWPFETNFYARNDLFQVELDHSWATKSWSSSGRCQDVSNLVFRQEPFKLKDILLASKLLDQEVVNAVYTANKGAGQNFFPSSRNHYLNVLADKCIVFDASTEKQQVNINYARHYYNGELSFGIQIPLVRRKNKLILKSCLTEFETEVLKRQDPLNLATDEQVRLELVALGFGTAGPGDTGPINQGPDGLTPTTQAFEVAVPVNNRFFQRYIDFKDFFEDVLDRKNIEFANRDREIGLGDIKTFLNFEVLSQHCERFIVGGSVTFPSSRLRDTGKLWDAELGNEGFTLFTLFGSMLFAKHRYFNAHIFCSGSLSPSTHVDRRQSLNREFNSLIAGSSTIDLLAKEVNTPGSKPFDEFMIFSEQILLAKNFGPLLDSDIRNFPTRAKRLKVRRGAEFKLRVGNLMERFLFSKGYLDIYYDFRAKGKDYLSCVPGSPFVGSIYTNNSYQIAHKIGGRYSYVFDESWRAHMEFTHTFAGRNVLRDYEFGIALSADF